MNDADTRESRPARRIPAPAQNEESKAFWDAAREHRLLLKHCRDCGKPHWYPRTICPLCFSSNTEWKESAGNGEVYSFSVQSAGVPAPFAIAYVTLEEGVSLLTNIVDCDFDQLRIGQKVQLKWTATSEEDPPVFTFAPV
jgi:Predicted nucleic-acid-binding protein containing a Zn-ribbon